MVDRRKAVNWSAMMNPVANRLLGSPSFIETPGVLRWGHKGRMRVDTRRGRWHDFESGESGGVVDLVTHSTSLTRPEAIRWLREEGFFEAPGVIATGRLRDEQQSLSG